MSVEWVCRSHPGLQALLDKLRTRLPERLPEAGALHLFGGIAQGSFQPPWSDIDLIAWVAAPDVTPEMEERANALWQSLAGEPFGDLIYLYVAPRRTMAGPLNPAGGGVTGGPRSVRIYRHMHKAMEGYPLSLPDTVSLVRYGVPLVGRLEPEALPAVPADWPVLFMRPFLQSVLGAVERGAGPYGTGALAERVAWGPEGTASHPIWFARHLYSLHTGEMIPKPHAMAWYLGRRPVGALADALWLALGWRERGGAPEAEVSALASLVRPALREFLAEALPLAGLGEPDPSDDAAQALRQALDRLD